MREKKFNPFLHRKSGKKQSHEVWTSNRKVDIELSLFISLEVAEKVFGKLIIECNHIGFIGRTVDEL